MNLSKNLTLAYIRAWCEEWDIDNADYKRFLEWYAEGDEENLIDFMSDVARERRIAFFKAGKQVVLGDFLKSSPNWDYDRPFTWLPL